MCVFRAVHSPCVKGDFEALPQGAASTISSLERLPLTFKFLLLAFVGAPHLPHCQPTRIIRHQRITASVALPVAATFKADGVGVHKAA